MAGSAMPLLRRDKFLRIVLAAPLLLAGAKALAAQAPQVSPLRGNIQLAAAQTFSSTESPLPIFEMHSGFWVNLHHFLYLQSRLLKSNSSAEETGRGAAQPDELPVSLVDFPEADIRAWQDAVAFYSSDLARRDLLLNGDMEIINN